MRNNILITGATGHLGQSLIENLRSNSNIIAYGRKEFDLQKPTKLNLQDVKTIYHLASDTKKNNFEIEVSGTKNLVEQAVQNGVEHFIYISIVGTDSVPIKYFKTKKQTELTIINSGIPFTILRATQFFPFFEQEILKYLKFPIALFPSKILFQPIETKCVVQKLIDIGAKNPANGIVEIGGSRKIEIGDAIKVYLKHKNQSKISINIPIFLLGKLGEKLINGGLTTDDICSESITWEEWLIEQTKQ